MRWRDKRELSAQVEVDSLIGLLRNKSMNSRLFPRLLSLPSGLPCTVRQIEVESLELDFRVTLRSPLS